MLWGKMGNKGRQKFLYLLYLFDALAIILSFLIAYLLRNFGPLRMFLDAVQPIKVYLMALPFAVLLLFAVFYFSGLYGHEKRKEQFSELYSATRAIAIWILLIMSGSYLYKYDYSRVIVILFFFFTLLFISLGRLLLRSWEQTYYQKGKGLVRILIVGAGRPGRDLARRLKNYSTLGYKVVGFLDGKASNKRNFPVIGTLDEIDKIIVKENIQQVYIADPTLSHEDILDLMAKTSKKEIRFKVISNIFDLVANNIDIAHLESIPSLDLWRVQEGLWPGIPKRIFDLVFTCLLLVLTMPLFLLIALLIFLTNGSPVVLKQKRVGLHGMVFNMLKFRTMKKDTAKYADSPRDSKDARVTIIGRILRKTSLDELPQLANILKGEMSLVGPRPEMPQKVAGYKRWQKMRLEVKPGLTGLWQVLGRKDLPMEQNLEYDFYYLNNQSFLLDIIIIIRTIFIVLSGRGAY